MLRRARSAWGRYLAAVAAIGLATLARWALGEFTGHAYPFATIFLAVVFSAWYGGFGPAILAAALGFGSMLILPDNRPTPGSAVVGILFYIAFSLVIAALGGLMARARQRIETQIAELQQHHAALEDAAQRKDEFLAVLAHELRNPLAPIASALDILKQPRLDPSIAAQARDTADRQLQHMTRLIDDLLDVSRIMRGKIELQTQRVPLATIVERAIETVQPLIDREGHRLTVELPGRPVMIEADVVRLAQVLANLLSNAVKYTEAGGQIALSASLEGEELLLYVRDSGIGIDAESLPRLFDMFMQAVPGSGRSRGGLGIGLTLVKNLVELHGGHVVANSAGLGQGSEFLIRLPNCQTADETPQPASPPTPQRHEVQILREVKARREEKLQSEEKPLRVAPTRQEPTPIQEPARQKDTSRRRILVVDDNVDAAQSLAVLLRLRGHYAKTAFGGLEALEAVAADEPDLIFLDLGMPGMDGYEVARKLRADYPASLMLVALTGWGNEQDRVRTRRAGFDHHMTKPVDLAALEAVLALQKPLAEAEVSR
jgi:signal transduction histidine kinase/ActR/RegA family two-component response regulator